MQYVAPRLQKIDAVDYSGVTNFLSGVKDRILQKDLLEQKQAQQAIENERAEKGLLLQQDANKRAEESLLMQKKVVDDTVAGNQALNTYVGALGANAQDVVPEREGLLLNEQYQKNVEAMGEEKAGAVAQAQADTLMSQYNASPEQQIAHIGSVGMSTGDFDPSKLLQARKDALAVPQSTLEAKRAAEAAAIARAQKLQDSKELAYLKQNLKNQSAGADKLLTGSVTMYNPTTKQSGTFPAHMASQLESDGFTFGKPGDSTNGTSKAKTESAWNDLYNKTEDFSTNILGVRGDDTADSKKTLDMMKATGIDVNVATRIINAIDARGGDRVLDIDSLNDREIMPPVYDPVTDKELPYGTALEKAFKDGGLTITVDDKGVVALAKRTKVQETAPSVTSNKPILTPPTSTGVTKAPSNAVDLGDRVLNPKYAKENDRLLRLYKSGNSAEKEKLLADNPVMQRLLNLENRWTP